MDAGMLSCPNCGAAAHKDAVACTHCRAQLQTVACATCFGMNFVGAKHCSHCGAKTFAPLEESAPSAGPHACPRCRHGLETIAVGEAILEECSACGGLWVDSESFQKICEKRERSAAFVGLGSPLEAPGHAVETDRVRYVACPICGKIMNRVNFARCSGVIVDVCKSHGTWFDKDELQEILDFIQAGGLEHAQEREHERLRHENERLREEQRALHDHTGLPEPEAKYAVLVEAAGGLLGWLIKH
jgi:Zn-finger nucleic acid-binding protein